jgi:hypothetical protein
MMSDEKNEESWIYQEMIEKGIVQRLETGTRRDTKQNLQQGPRPEEILALQSILTKLITAHFPVVRPLADEWLNTPVDAEAIKKLLRKLFEAQTEEGARQILMEDRHTPEENLA